MRCLVRRLAAGGWDLEEIAGTLGMDAFARRSYGQNEIGYGRKIGIAAVDLQTAVTDPSLPLGGGPLIKRALDNSIRVLGAARAAGLPVACCFIGYRSDLEMPRWKVGLAGEQFRLGSPGARLDPRVFDPDYDLEICKPAPSIFFQTVAGSFFTREGVDTVVVLGAATSGCIRASVIDSFSLGYRTIVPEDCVGDHDEDAHRSNIRDMDRRYADITTADDVIARIQAYQHANS